MFKLTEIPTLDALVQNPALAMELPPQVAQSLLPQVAGLLAVLQVQAGKTPTMPKASAPEDMLIDKECVSLLIGLSVSWVEKHPDDLPPRRSVAGNPRWLKSEILAWVKNRPVYGG